MSTLQDLPNELLVAITKSVRDIRGLASMAKMNRRLNQIATPLLYREAVRREKHEALIHCTNEGFLGALKLLEAAGQNLNIIEMNIPDHSAIRVATFVSEAESLGFQAAFQRAGGIEQGVIHRAVLKGWTEVIRWLISHGVAVDFESVNLCKCVEVTGSPLHLALCRGQEEVAHILLANGARIEELESFIGLTAWQSAIQGRQPAAAMDFALSLASTQSEIVAGQADDFREEREQDSSGAVQTNILMSSGDIDIDSEHDKSSVTEKDVLGSVTALLDPIACIEAYADSEKSEAILGQKRNLERQKAHGMLPMEETGGRGFNEGLTAEILLALLAAMEF